MAKYAATEPVIPARIKALAVLRYDTLDTLYRKVPLGRRAVEGHVARGALPPPVAEAMRAELGPEGWAFVTGAVDVLQAPAALRPAAPPDASQERREHVLAVIPAAPPPRS